MTVYYRPLVQTGTTRPKNAQPIAGGWCWFVSAERIERNGGREIVAIDQIPNHVLSAIITPRADIVGLSMDKPRLMGVLNVTPDSFSDGGQFNATDLAVSRFIELTRNGADIVDIGGESTRPGAEIVPGDEEIARTVPVIDAIKNGPEIPISIDTRKAPVARAAIKAGASIVNDVSSFSFDPQMAEVVSENKIPVCLMHASGSPKTMQNNPIYQDVLLDVYDHLENRIAFAEAAGVQRNCIIIDPGIGFGKTIEHNLALLQGLSLFHTLGCPILLGASRKKFIGTLADAPNTADRVAGSVAVALAAIAQGVQFHRVHDIKETRQALILWAAATGTRQQ